MLQLCCCCSRCNVTGVRFLKILLLQASYAGTAHARTTTTTMVPSTYNFYYGHSVGSLGAYDLGRTQTRDVRYKAKHSPHSVATHIVIFWNSMSCGTSMRMNSS